MLHFLFYVFKVASSYYTTDVPEVDYVFLQKCDSAYFRSNLSQHYLFVLVDIEPAEEHGPSQIPIKINVML